MQRAERREEATQNTFSSSKETGEAQRSKLSTALMEALQVLKRMYRDECLSFSAAWPRLRRPEEEQEEDVVEETVIEVDPHVLHEMLVAGRIEELDTMVEASYNKE